MTEWIVGNMDKLSIVTTDCCKSDRKSKAMINQALVD